MSIFPITPLVRRVQAQVLQTFDVSEQTAEDYAAMVAALAEDHGGAEKATQLDWDYRIRKDGADKKWRWRSEDERVRFETAQKQKYQAYESFISKRHA
jgi:hypothetical protein